METTLKTRIYNLIESTGQGSWQARVFDAGMATLIVANVTAVVLQTVAGLRLEYSDFFTYFEIFSVAVFTVEYGARIWVCTERPTGADESALVRRMRYMLTPMALVDLLAIAPFYLSLFVKVDLRFLRMFRLLRLLKLTRYSSALEIFAAVLKHQRKPLLAAILLMLVMLIFSASIIFMFENRAQPQAFSSIPNAMWWSIATLTTVGYGDVTPLTLGGRVFGALIMIVGIGMFALPAGILATGFAQELRKRDFVVSWRLVAKVPLFAGLDALSIAEVAGLLHPKLVPARYAIVHRGEQTDCMYFIAQGEVQVDVGHGAVHRLAEGDHFGEIALLSDVSRTATVTAISECQLLILEQRDLKRLRRDHPQIHSSLAKIADRRLAQLRREDSL